VRELIIPLRPNRSKPRVLKRRPKPFPRMQEPRSFLKDTLAGLCQCYSSIAIFVVDQKGDLKAQNLDFIADFNDTRAKPFKWTYQGEALKA